jgi:hypothetical protein
MLWVTAYAQDTPEYRTWTDTGNRQVEATLARVSAGAAVLRLRNGATINVPLTNLSTADRAWLAAHAASPTASPTVAQNISANGASAGNTDSPGDWPRTVALEAAPEIKVVKEDSTKGEYVYSSDHFEFHCDSSLSPNVVREFSKVFEATRLLNTKLPLGLDPQPEDGRSKFQAHIFTNRDDYLKAGGVKHSGGIYSPADRAIMVPLESLGVRRVGTRIYVDSMQDYSTLVHETTHQMMNHWLPVLPTWYVEGSAEYVEIAKYTNGRFSLVQQDSRLRDRLYTWGGYRTFEMVPIQELMTMSYETWTAALGAPDGASRNYASALALTYYFYHLDGRGDGSAFRSYLAAIKDSHSPAEGEAIAKKYLLRGRSYAALQSDVQKALRRIGITVTFAPGEKAR